MIDLIVTNLQEFWPDDLSNAVLAGPWCLPLPSQKLKHNNYDLPMIESPWKTKDISDTYIITQDIYVKLLPHLAAILNQIHHKNYSNRHWQLVIGPWFNLLTHIIYDRYSRLLCVKAAYNNLRILGVSIQDMAPLKESIDLCIYNNHSDLFNLQLFTLIAKKLDMDVKYMDHRIDEPYLQKAIFIDKKNKSLRLKISRYLLDLFAGRAAIICYGTGHYPKFLAKLFVSSRGKITEKDLIATISPPPLQKKLRQEFNFLLQQKLKTLDLTIIEKIILEIAIDTIPLMFLEGYAKLEVCSSQYFGNSIPQIICSANRWYFDEPFKLWAAKCSNKGTKLYGLQHGGNYGVVEHLFAEDFEINTLDGFLTWGWGKPDANGKIIATPAPKLLDLQKRTSGYNNYKGILFAGAGHYRYLEHFPELPDNFSTQLSYLQRFFAAIKQDLHKQFLVRMHYEDRIWEIKNRLSMKFPSLIFDSWDKTFRQRLAECKIYVCDHLYTTYAESLAANVPTILFWDENIIKLRSTAQPIFSELRKVGILHNTPEGAAAWLEKIHLDVESWWLSDQCQAAVRNFCRNYARTSDTPLVDWLKIFTDMQLANFNINR